VSYLLNVLYVLLLVIASPWLVLRSLRTGRYREGFAAKLLGRVPRRESDRPCVWFHAVSVGEVNLLAPLLAEIARRHPDWECVISTTTTTGLALARKKYPGHAVFYCPLDFSWAVKAALRRIRPRALVLVETELWPNLILAAKARGVRVAIANGRLSEHSFRGYLRLRPVIASLVQRLDLIAAQNEEYAERFRALGARPETVCITGSVKFDGAQTDRRNPQTIRLRQLAGFHDDDLVFLAGSTQEPEEALALATFRQLQDEWPRLRLVLVPRHPERFDSVAELLTTSGLAWQRRSELPLIPDPRPLTPSPDARILLVDAVGELGAWWGTAQIAFVGGGLGKRGGQNMIEPAAYGAAVSFGPNTHNFRDIVAAMLARRAAVVVRDGEELTAFVHRALADPNFAAELGRRARALVADQLGATARTIDLVAPLVDGGRETLDRSRAA
jgi:3-deoxy-D-manno-octulosonic-acid transferase